MFCYLQVKTSWYIWDGSFLSLTFFGQTAFANDSYQVPKTKPILDGDWPRQVQMASHEPGLECSSMMSEPETALQFWTFQFQWHSPETIFFQTIYQTLHTQDLVGEKRKVYFRIYFYLFLPYRKVWSFYLCFTITNSFLSSVSSHIFNKMQVFKYKYYT